jgi:hypothetical protein
VNNKLGIAILFALGISLAFSVLFVISSVFVAWNGSSHWLAIPFLIIGLSLLGVYIYCAIIIRSQDFFDKWQTAKSVITAIFIVMATNLLVSQIFSLKSIYVLFQSDCRALSISTTPNFSMFFTCALRAFFAVSILNICLWLPPVILIKFGIIFLDNRKK